MESRERKRLLQLLIFQNRLKRSKLNFHTNKKEVVKAFVLSKILVNRDSKGENNNIIKRTVKRKYWVRPIFTVESRFSQGAQNLIAEMRLTDHDKYFNYLRMGPDRFDNLLKLIGPKIEKMYVIREPISTSTRLALTLRYLATGDSMVSIAYAFRVGKNTVSNIISETCLAIWECLHDIVLLKPCEEEWKRVAEGFEKWNFPNCIGAIDGKHVVIQAQPNSGSTYYNYKGCHSVVLLALCDASYSFTLVDIGAYGKQSDGGVLRNSVIGKLFNQDMMQLPPSKTVPNGPMLPYVIVADEAFALTKYMLRPYPKSTLDHKRKVFNYRLSRARRVIESAFGILAGRWRIYRKPIIASENTVNRIIQATVCLHNYLIQQDLQVPFKRKPYVSLDEDILQQPTGAFQDISSAGSNNFSRSAAAIRDLYLNYFFNEGAVEFQWQKVLQNEF